MEITLEDREALATMAHRIVNTWWGIQEEPLSATINAFINSEFDMERDDRPRPHESPLFRRMCEYVRTHPSASVEAVVEAVR